MSTTPVAVVELLPTKIWIESDICGTRYVVAQHEGMEAFTVAAFFYRYGYTDNATLHGLATNLAIQFGAVEPVEEKFRAFPTDDGPVVEL